MNLVIIPGALFEQFRVCLKHQISVSVLASGQFLKVLGTVGQSRESSLIDF